MSNFNNNNKNHNNYESFCYNHSNHTGEISRIENDEIKCFWKKPSINYKISRTDREMLVPHLGH